MLPFIPLQHIFAALLLTMLAAFAHTLIPEKRRAVTATPENPLILIYDGSQGGSTRAYWDSKQASNAICEIKQSDVFPYCGFLFSLGDGKSRGWDFTRYETIRVSVKYAGEASRVRMFMRNFDNRYATKGDVETAKFNNISIPVEDLSEPLNIRLEDITVAEWWLENAKIPREQAQPDLNNIIKFGFDLTHPVPFGRHELQLERVELIGEWFSEKQWYLSILVFWMVVAGVWALRHRFKMRSRAVTDARRLAELQSPSTEFAAAERIEKLTGAMSRAGLAQKLTELYGADGRSAALSVVLIDIDDFTKIDRRYGHDTGNKTLAEVGHLLVANSRATDIVCHWANDRFLFIAPVATGIELAAFAEKMRGLVVKHTFEHEGKPYPVTISAGVAESASGERFEQTFALASEALLQAKAAGKNTVLYRGR